MKIKKCYCDKGKVWSPINPAFPEQGGDWIKCTEPLCVNGYIEELTEEDEYIKDNFMIDNQIEE